MKALEMMIARDLKTHRHFQFCLRCGHMNNGEEEVWKRICRCAVPVLVNPKQYRGMPLSEIRAIPELRHLLGGEERTIVSEDEVDRQSRYRT